MKILAKPHLLLIEPMMAQIMAKLDVLFTVHRLFEADDRGNPPRENVRSGESTLWARVVNF